MKYVLLNLHLKTPTTIINAGTQISKEAYFRETHSVPYGSADL